jgi:hypothetical protein
MLSPADKEALDRETARIQAFKGRVILLTCACGNDLETDAPSEEAAKWACSRCGQSNWKLRRSASMAKDPSAPPEMKKRSKKDIAENGEEE